MFFSCVANMGFEFRKVLHLILLYDLYFSVLLKVILNYSAPHCKIHYSFIYWDKWQEYGHILVFSRDIQ